MPIVLGVLSRTSNRTKAVSLLHLFLPRMQQQLPHLFSFRLTVYPSHQFLQFYGRFYHASPCLTSRSKKLDSAWPLRSIRITRLHRYFGPLRHPLAFGPFPVSTVIGPTFLREFLPGASRTSPVSIASLLPCRRPYPASVVYPFSQSGIAHDVFTEDRKVRPPVFWL